jgi:signal transduction histidine kinase/ActR/RegA family two-component response regulator
MKLERTPVPKPAPWRRWALPASLGLALAGGVAHGWDAVRSAQPPTPPWLATALWIAVASGTVAALLLAGRLRLAARQSRALDLAVQRLADYEVASRHTAAQLQRAHAAAEAAELAKGRFVAAASHDLRQPAHALGLYTAALRAGPLAPEQAEIADCMQASLAALEAMFASLLDVSRVDAGALLPQWDTVALAPLLHRLAQEWATEAEGRGLRLVVHVADPEAMSVSDPLLLERVLRNLLANAVKYTRRGGVLLACRTRTAPGGARSLRIELWDTGVGMAPAEQARVFEEFYQVANHGHDRAGGLGLGLAIVQRLVHLLQLRLTLHSLPGRGSVFFLDGLVPAGSAPQRAAAARQQMRRLTGMHVAVLEDDTEVRDAMRRLLRLWGCEVVDAADASALLQRLSPSQAVHAVVADVRLAGGRHGPDEVRTLQAAWACAVPVLLVSGEAAPEQMQALQDAGHSVLTKPVSPARLRAWLEQATLGNGIGSADTDLRTIP